MAVYTNEFKKFIVEERIIHKKTLTQIENEHGILRGTVHLWVTRYHEKTLFINWRKKNISSTQKEIEYELLKSLSLF